MNFKTSLTSLKRWIQGSALITTILAPQLAKADGMPWETPLQSIQTSLQGSTAKSIITISIIVAGLAFALGEQGGFFRKAAGVVFGAAIAVGASTFASSLFGI